MKKYEFRWLDREIKRDPSIAHYYGPDREIVLQFRSIHEGCYHEDVYSPWTDVPVVRADG